MSHQTDPQTKFHLALNLELSSQQMTHKNVPLASSDVYLCVTDQIFIHILIYKPESYSTQKIDMFSDVVPGLVSR